jgi:hypothetical protein
VLELEDSASTVSFRGARHFDLTAQGQLKAWRGDAPKWIDEGKATSTLVKVFT